LTKRTTTEIMKQLEDIRSDRRLSKESIGTFLRLVIVKLIGIAISLQV